MEATHSDSVLKNTLKKFLTHGDKPEYKELTVELVSIKPLRITDTEGVYLESTNFLSPEDIATVQKHYTKGHEIVLKKWEFIFTRIPNTHDYFTDLNVAEYELKTLDHKQKHEVVADYHSLVDDKDLK